MSIYSLTDPRTNVCRYVGRSHNPQRRLRVHLERPHSERMREWLGDLAAAGIAPILARHEGKTEADWIVELRPDLNIQRGRRKEEPERLTDARLDIRLPEDERLRVDQAAEAERLPITLWVRSVLKREATKVLAKLREKKGGR